MFTVYKVFGPHSPLAYYGYSQSEDPLQSFIGSANSRKEPDRGDVRLLDINNGDVDSLQVEIIDVYDDEMDAFIIRNETRARETDSITGPTQFPGNIARRVEKERPEQLTECQRLMKMKNARSARRAYALGMWTIEQIKRVVYNVGRDEIRIALDVLSPVDFDLKYKQHM